MIQIRVTAQKRDLRGPLEHFGPRVKPTKSPWKSGAKTLLAHPKGRKAAEVSGE
jgi:hypothetical protein